MKTPESFQLFVYRVQVVKVIDGDTLDIVIDQGFHGAQEVRVRLAEVNTPEIFGPNATHEGQLASDITKAWVGVGQAISSSKYPFIYWSANYDAKDKYGRSLGYLYRAADKTCLNEWLLSYGWGA